MGNLYKQKGEITFVPIALKKGWMYFPGVLFKGLNGHPVLLGHVVDVCVLVDVDLATIVQDNLPDDEESVMAALNYSLNRDEILSTEDLAGAEAGLKEVEDEFGPKPPIHTFNIYDPAAKKFMDKYVTDKIHSWGDEDDA
ncbi:hypothetical protein [Lactobacillus sp. PSON]|uniref:hypothetical protein n=1 Tax=Lactobacillus sp. PSON TaxID=3455454 RepID=UPI00404195AD